MKFDGFTRVFRDAMYNALLGIITPVAYSIRVILTPYKSDLSKEFEKCEENWK